MTLAEEKKNPQIAIIGAGPAGLVAALAARKLNFDVKVFEQAPDFAQVGGGVMIHSNGQRVLDALNLLESFRPQMAAVTRGILETERGAILTEVDFTEIDVPHNRVAVVWRYQLQEHLLNAVHAAEIEVAFNHRLKNLETSGVETFLTFENGASANAEIVIAADGVNSRARQACGIAFEKIPIKEGWIRGASETVVSNKAFREIWGDDGRRFGIAPLFDEKTYFYARVPLGEWDAIRENRLEEWIESWKAFGTGDAVEILRGVRDWQKINYSELFEIRAAEWAKPPVFLVGDAAHAMTPNVGQGANSAMVDALFLSLMLGKANGKSLAEVGREYTKMRRPFVMKIQNTARMGGKLAAKTSATGRLMRGALFTASRNLGFLRRKNLLLTAGYNPPENAVFEAFNDAVKTSR